MPHVIFLSICFALEGLIIGSFLNVVIDRIPSGKSLGGRSSCDSCGRTLSVTELIPVVSYLLQRGRSTCCKEKLKLQYPLVEACTGASFFVVTYQYLQYESTLHTGNILALISLLLMMAVSIAIAGIDFRHHIIPDGLQVCLLVAVVLYHTFSGTLQVQYVGHALIVVLPILLLYLITRGRGMGFGDVKMQMTLGLWLGLIHGFLGLYIGFLAGAFYGVVLILLRKAGRKSQIAFGPFLLLGAWVSYLYKPTLIEFVRFMFRL